MKRFFLPTMVAVFVCLSVLACSGEKIDGHLVIELKMPCAPTLAEMQAGIDRYLISVEDLNGTSLKSTTWSNLDILEFEVDESDVPVRIVLEGVATDLRPVMRGQSDPVVLVSGQDARISIPIFPLGQFALVASNRAECSPLPFPAVHHTATVYPAGQVVVVGSSVADVDSSHAAFLFDTAKLSATPLSTPDFLHRARHSATRLADGRLVVLGGKGISSSAPQDLAILSGTDGLLGEYDPDFNPAGLQFSLLPGVLVFNRSPHFASLFHGDQVLINDGSNEAEMFLSQEELSGVIQLNTASDPFPPSGDRVATVVALDENRAIVMGGEVDHNGMLVVQAGSRRISFEPFGLSTGRRDLSVGVALTNGTVMFIGGQAGQVVNDPQILIVDPLAKALYDVPADARYFPRQGFSATLVREGLILVVGGTSAGVDYVAGSTFYIERYGQGVAQWAVTSGPAMILPRTDHTASLLPDGSLLIVGGTGPDGQAEVPVSSELLNF